MILIVIYLKNIISSINGYDLKIKRSKENMSKASSTSSKSMRPLKNGTVLFIKG